jgi:head-tail adaptor
MSLIWENGKVREMTAEEIAEMNAQAEQVEREYWLNISYDEAVNTEIRKKYSESQEFAILRQANAKPEEYEIYYNYCEECKAYVKAKQKEVLE